MKLCDACGIGRVSDGAGGVVTRGGFKQGCSAACFMHLLGRQDVCSLGEADPEYFRKLEEERRRTAN